MKSFSVGILSAILATLGNVAWAAAPLVPATSTTNNSSKIEVSVRDEKNVLPGAGIWMEDQNGKLLEKGTTSENGTFVSQVGLEGITGGIQITAAASGHSVVSLLQITGNKVEFILPQNFNDQFAILSGSMKGLQESDDESEATLGMVSKAFSATELANLEISSLISPMKDTLDILGPRKVPSNLVIPDQTFPIFFVPVKVNKPIYRFPAPTGSVSRYFGASGLVDVQATVNALRNDQPWEIINLLQFKKVGMTAPITAPRNANEILNLDVTTNVVIKDTMPMQSGEVRDGIEGNAAKRRLALSLWEPEADLFIPTDIKLVDGSFKGLVAIDKSTAKMVEVLATEEGDRFRSEWHLASIAKLPNVTLQASIDYQGADKPITLTGSADAKLSVIRLEEIQKTSIGGKRYEEKWVVVAPKTGAIRLPTQALHDLKDSVAKVSNVSADMMEMGTLGFSASDSEEALGGNRIQIVEKVRKALKTAE